MEIYTIAKSFFLCVIQNFVVETFVIALIVSTLFVISNTMYFNGDFGHQGFQCNVIHLKDIVGVVVVVNAYTGLF